MRMKPLWATAILLFVGLQPMRAQGVAEAALACFENGDRCDPTPIPVAAILLEPQKFGSTPVSTVLDGLERIALHADDPGLRQKAAREVAAAGWKGYRSTPIPGVVSRLIRIHRVSTDHWVRSIIISQMMLQVEDVEAVNFLERVAQEDDPRERGEGLSTAYLAVNSLSHMGPQGVAVLEQLHKQGTVSPTAAEYLKNVKARGFNEPPTSREARCQLAVAIFISGSRAASDTWAGREISICGVNGGRAIAVAMRNARTESDTVFLDFITQATQYVHDGLVYEAAMDVAADPGATVQARIFSLRSLIYLMWPGIRPSYAGLKSGATPGYPHNCIGATVTHSVPSVANPVPGNYKEQIEKLATRLKQDSTVPVDVRAAAVCARMVARR
jgi:hypothetical protein